MVASGRGEEEMLQCFALSKYIHIVNTSYIIAKINKVQKWFSVIHCASKGQNHMTISIDKEALDEIQTYSNKNSQQLRSKRKLPQTNKEHLQKSLHFTYWWKIKSFPSKIGTKTRMSTLATSLYFVLEILDSIIRQEKGNEEVKLSDGMFLHVENSKESTKTRPNTWDHDLV